MKKIALIFISLFSFTLFAQEIEIYKGWNIISSPTQGDIDNPRSLLSEYIGDNTIWGYDANSGYYSATTIERGNGYWIHSSKSGNISIEKKSTSLVPTVTLLKSILVPKRWNLVGTDVNATFNDIRNTLGVTKVYAYDGDLGEYITDGFINPGTGMWIYGVEYSGPISGGGVSDGVLP